ncbi:hypothetical protein [Streptomyces sp. NPDC127119]|uniref:hypothetical protein n=1 Tax=Streptomyces sp. NPDC127119 TaxID=3345370 RepID=UPI003638D3FE
MSKIGFSGYIALICPPSCGTGARLTTCQIRLLKGGPAAVVGESPSGCSAESVLASGPPAAVHCAWVTGRRAASAAPGPP